jgi:hypothetical protein
MEIFFLELLSLINRFDFVILKQSDFSIKLSES